jgi:hypothetical protein
VNTHPPPTNVRWVTRFGFGGMPRIERLGRGGTVVAVAINVMLALTLVILEVLVAH